MILVTATIEFYIFKTYISVSPRIVDDLFVCVPTTIVSDWILGAFFHLSVISGQMHVSQPELEWAWPEGPILINIDI